jgi:hypothetical protein
MDDAAIIVPAPRFTTQGRPSRWPKWIGVTTGLIPLPKAHARSRQSAAITAGRRIGRRRRLKCFLGRANATPSVEFSSPGRGIQKPGTPVSTTGVNGTFVVMPSRISGMASSGRVEISNFSRVQRGLVEVVRKALPRCTAQASATRAGVWRRCAMRDHRVIHHFWILGMSQRCERLQYNAVVHKALERPATPR